MEYKYFPVNISADGTKTPLITGWQSLATSDAGQLKLWQEMFRDRLTHWGMPTGSTTGVLALDVDVKKVDGFGTLQTNQLPVPPTTSQRTVTGGAHYLYHYPQDGQRYGNRVNVYPGIDVRGEGGYIVMYGTDQTPPTHPPEWLSKASLKIHEAPQGEVIGVSHEVAVEMLERCLEEIYDAPEGERNHTLNAQGFRVAQLVVSGALTEVEARAQLKDAALGIGLTPHEIERTLDSCFRASRDKPLTSPFGEPDEIIGATAITPPAPVNERWTPPYFSVFQLNDKSKLKKPQLFKDWSTQDLHITTADGGTGKTTLKLYEAICLAIGDPFLGFECVNPGKTLFITGEDTADKIGAMLGAIVRQMGLMNDPEKLNKILSSIVVKKDSSLCIISKDKFGFLNPNEVSLNKVLQAVEDIKPKMIIFDPISMFWGSESALNDMALAVSRFMSTLVEKSGACVEMINHMGKASSSSKDMSQFAGRGGTGLPSHARVARVLRPVDTEEYQEMTGTELEDKKSAMLCNVSKFSDGSRLLNKPFLIVRDGFLFERLSVEERKVRDEKKQDSDADRVFKLIKAQRKEGKYPTKSGVIGYFMSHAEKISKDRVTHAINCLTMMGRGTEAIRLVQGPDAEQTERVIVITDQDGNELDTLTP